ncbi:sugar transferase [Sanguibacter suaedae]|uniref:Sugar transferase n=1 Tax=Sanguibacter suaedae TaxID=2795737 RepID=A0A934IE49_9MICO|nr:sugar transferase [Sanguibacter suaedae]MBI9116196.1 sugar transferase [Sanguibacter suaedae]
MDGPLGVCARSLAVIVGTAPVAASGRRGRTVVQARGSLMQEMYESGSSTTTVDWPRQPGAGASEQEDGLASGPSGVRWWSAYAVRVLITDAAAIYVAVFIAYVVRFDGSGTAVVSGDLSPSYLVVSIVLMWAWIASLVVGRTQDRRLVGIGPAEYQRIFAVTWRLFAAVAVVAYMFRMEIGRGYLAIALPLGLLLILLGRLGWRWWLHRKWGAGEMQSRVLVVGHRRKAERLVGELARRSGAGFGVVGVCLPPGEAEDGLVRGLPVLGEMGEAASVAKREKVDAVTVVGSDSLTSETVRSLGWELEGSGIDLALTMELNDVAGPRVLVQPMSALPLVYVDEPRFSGPKYVLKTAFDWLSTLAITLIVSPVLIVLAVLVKLSSPGPVIFRQKRVGLDGSTFEMLKFRSMYQDAEQRLEQLVHENEGNDVMFKMKDDPRVTSVGKRLRRFSLDELPQLFNVLRGDMSLVGPRPPLPREVDQYESHVHRRLLVKPGITGLWQVSGRSDLSWDETVRLDLYYTENWTFFGDILILLRTVRTVLSSSGAY